MSRVIRHLRLAFALRAAHTPENTGAVLKQTENRWFCCRHLETLVSLSTNGPTEADVVNANETHLINNVDNGLTVVFAEEKEARYANAVSGVEGSPSWWFDYLQN